MIQKAEWNLGFTKFTLETRMEDEDQVEKDKVQASIEEQEKKLDTNKVFLAWLKDQK